MATVMSGRRPKVKAADVLQEEKLEQKKHDQVERTITRLDTVVDRLDTILNVLKEDADVTVQTQSTSKVTKQGAENGSGESTDLSRSSGTSRRHKKRTAGA